MEEPSGGRSVEGAECVPVGPVEDESGGSMSTERCEVDTPRCCGESDRTGALVLDRLDRTGAEAGRAHRDRERTRGAVDQQVTIEGRVATGFGCRVDAEAVSDH